ncbi:MAG TPA: hypothetical protein VFQ36_04165 [Ktedonobacteraceae bacterium]|nr:hypothetical protein [Ktedonobacteraceae bacterium]
MRRSGFLGPFIVEATLAVAFRLQSVGRELQVIRKGVDPKSGDAGMSEERQNNELPARKRRGRWIMVGILVVLLVSIPTFFIVRYITRSTPDTTLDAFCNALQQENYPSAYARFSARLQRTISETTFVGIFSQDKVNACTHGTTDDAGTSVTSTIKFVHASRGVNNDIVTLTKDSNDSWQIDDIYRQT